MIKKFLRIFNKKSRFEIFQSRGFYRLMNDEKYLKKVYELRTDKKLNLKNPATFNEKLQWLKLHDRKPEYSLLVDKYEVKKVISERIGEKYIIPTIGVWDRVEDINFDELPEKFVMKCTHNSGGLVICKNKADLDIEKVKGKLSKALKINYFYRSREWPYKNVKPRIIAEKFMKDSNQENDGSLNVYKIFCFGGKPYIIQTIQNDKTPEETIDYFDTDWNLLELRQNFPNSKHPLSKPQTLEEMLTLAEKLTKGHPFLRADFYDVDGEIYFSELTFYSDAGMATFEPEEWDYKLGELIKLPDNKK